MLGNNGMQDDIGRCRPDSVWHSASVHRDAQSLVAAVAIEEKAMPTAKRIRMRVERPERTTLACRVFSVIQYSKVKTCQATALNR